MPPPGREGGGAHTPADASHTIITDKPKPTTAALTVRDADELAEREAVIERGLQTFIDVGTALTEIRDQRLYREQYGTFEDYCQGRWQFSDRRARQLIDAAGMATALPSGTVVPVTESQARELSGLTIEDAAEVMRLAHSEADGKITAKAIAATREQVTQRCYPYREHPFIAVFPWDQGVVDDIAARLDQTRQQLLADIANPDEPPQSLTGFLRLAFPIVLSSDGTTIIDGRLRYAAYRKAGITACFKRIEPDADNETIIRFIYAYNVCRKSYTKDELAAIARDIGPTAVMKRYGVNA